MSAVRTAVRGLSEYAVEQDAARAKLNQNESATDVPAALKAAVLDRLRRTAWNRYPPQEAGGLVRALSRHTGHPEAGIMVSNGSNEAIQVLASAVCRRGDAVLTAEPGFAVYSRTAVLAGARCIETPLGPDLGFDVEAVFRDAAEARLIFIASPHNPTGAVFPREAVAPLCRAAGAKGGLVVLDEAYFEFCGRTVLDLVPKLGNLVVLRTMSKAFRLAGARLGFLFGPDNLVRDIRKARLPFSLGIFQQAAGEVLLENNGLIRRAAAAVVREREALFAELAVIPDLRPFPSAANFILFESRRVPGRCLFEILRGRGVLVRHFATPRLENMIRVTVGTPAENRRFLREIRAACTNKTEGSSS
ncbi:MAG: histidinol-phosphate transaminase [Acidobacteriota bacterium]|nr:histidinol-phosphate transaminase [Acidobacteriota bacterium]